MPRTAPNPRRSGRHRATGARPARPTSRRPPTALLGRPRARRPDRPASTRRQRNPGHLVAQPTAAPSGPRSRRPRAGRRRGPRCPRRRVPYLRASGPAARRPTAPGRRPGNRRPDRTTARERAGASARPRAAPKPAAIARGLRTPSRQPVIAPDAIPIAAATTTPRPVNAPGAAPTAAPGARRVATAAPGASRVATAAPDGRRVVRAGRARRPGSSGSGRAGRGRCPSARCMATVLGDPPRSPAVGLAVGVHRPRRGVDLRRIGTLGTVFTVCYLSGCVLASAWVRRSGLFGRWWRRRCSGRRGAGGRARRGTPRPARASRHAARDRRAAGQRLPDDGRDHRASCSRSACPAGHPARSATGRGRAQLARQGERSASPRRS